MSMTLLLWKTPVVDDPDEAESLLGPYYESGDESAFAASDDLVRATDALFRAYPYDDGDEMPWSDPPMLSDRVATLDIRWGGDGAVLDTVLELAREHELVLYDPQGPDVHCPPWTPDDPAPDLPHPSLGEYVRVLVLGAIGAVLIVVGWIASITVLSWLLIAVGVFLAILAALFLYATVRASVSGTRIE